MCSSQNSLAPYHCVNSFIMMGCNTILDFRSAHQIASEGEN